ncbi:hypothetical protein B0J14DRAFT_18556 [Halenospora varia]|nr:hypothetical protein B0J14DRAFT_18556 [Halenospora varia]
MFGRGRRRPLLGAAVVMGASRSAAKHEVAKQEQVNRQMQQTADREALEKKLEREETERRTQQAIDNAIEEERKRTAQIEAEREREEERRRMAQIEAERQYATISNAGSAGATYYTGQPPSYPNYNPSTPQIKQAQARYCSECGNLCKFEDKFCSKCGFKLPAGEAERAGPIGGNLL